MKLKAYSIFDEVAKEYTTPFFAGSDEAACRAVLGSFNSQSQLVLYPSDYTLILLGEFDTEEGTLEAGSMPVQLIKNLIPVALRECALDGTFERGVDDETKKDTSA